MGTRNPSKSELALALSEVEDFICPHINTADHITILPRQQAIRVGSELEQYPFYRSRFAEQPKCTPGPCHTCTTALQHCHRRGCNTTWKLFRRHATSQDKPDEICLSIGRTIDPAWGEPTWGERFIPSNSNWSLQIGLAGGLSGLKSSEGRAIDGIEFLREHTEAVNSLVLYLRLRGVQEPTHPIMHELIKPKARTRA